MKGRRELGGSVSANDATARREDEWFDHTGIPQRFRYPQGGIVQ